MSTSSNNNNNHQLLIDASNTLQQFNEKSDLLTETIQPLLVEYCELLKTLRTEVVKVNMRASNCVEKAKLLADKERVDLKVLRLGTHQEELDLEEKKDYEEHK